MSLFTRRDNLAYAAGLFDGEGCISIRKTKKGYYTVSCQISMTADLPVQFMVKNFGGSLSKRYFRKDNTRKPQRVWAVHGRACEEFLEQVLLCLRVKWYEAILALILCSSFKSTIRTGTKVPEHTLAVRELIRLECKAAKRVVHVC